MTDRLSRAFTWLRRTLARLTAPSKLTRPQVRHDL